MSMSIGMKNSEGYLDPTAYSALTAVRREEIKKSGVSQETPKVYICSPYRGDTAANVANALRYCRFAVARGKFPICPHVYLTRFLNDDVADEREQGLAFGKRLLRECRELWLFGDKVSEGMKGELLQAETRNIPIRRFDSQLNEIQKVKEFLQ